VVNIRYMSLYNCYNKEINITGVMKRVILVYNIRYFVEVDGLQRLYKLEIINRG